MAYWCCIDDILELYWWHIGVVLMTYWCCIDDILVCWWHICGILISLTGVLWRESGRDVIRENMWNDSDFNLQPTRVTVRFWFWFWVIVFTKERHEKSVFQQSFSHRFFSALILFFLNPLICETVGLIPPPGDCTVDQQINWLTVAALEPIRKSASESGGTVNQIQDL